MRQLCSAKCAAAAASRAFLTKMLPALVLAGGLTAIPAIAGTLPIGSISFDPYNNTGGTFDITNLTGALSSTFPDSSAPVTTQVAFSDIVLTIDYQNGGVVTEKESQFSPDGFDGFLGNFDVTAGGIPIKSATLSGDDWPGLVQLNDGSEAGIALAFSATVWPSTGDTLQIGDAAVIDVSQTPEPAYAGILGAGLAIIALGLRKKGVRA